MKTSCSSVVIALALACTKLTALPTPDRPITPRYLLNNGTARLENDKDLSSLNRSDSRGREFMANSYHNKNPKCKSKIYPRKDAEDAPYSLSEKELRSAIYFPKSFSPSSRKQPVILVPGTAVMAGRTYMANLAPLLAKSDFANPLWINIPDESLGDAQENSEYVAYAMNYVSSITGQKVAVVAWSQGNLNAQWAMKYWPSTRNAATDLVSLSPDFHGTTEAAALCDPQAAPLGCTPSIYQQLYDSKFVETLRANGGDSAYVPTTSIYSATDEIVQPQSGIQASAFLGDDNGIAVTNVEVQKACPGMPAGTDVTHEGMLYNSLAYALLKDAIVSKGPADLDRIDRSVCADPAASELDADEITATDAILGDAVANILRYPNKVKQEPPIKKYARA